MSIPELLLWLSFGIISYSYFFYPIIIKIVEQFVHKNRIQNEQLFPSVAMIVSAYNEENIIQEKIDNFLVLDYPPDKLTLYIGSDGSSDRTNQILADLEEENIQCIIFSERSGKLKVMNELVALAKCEILVFSDANTIYAPDAIKKLVRHFADTSVGAVCGRLVLVKPENINNNGEIVYWNYENSLKASESNIRTTLGANGGIYALRKALFQTLPINTIITDDFIIPLLAVMQGKDTVYDVDAKAFESVSPTVIGEFHRRSRISASNFNSIKFVKKLLYPGSGFVAFALWSHKIIRWLIPYFLLIIFICSILLLEMSFYKLFFCLEIIFLICAIAGYFNDKFKPFHYAAYFLTVNTALGIGLLKYIFRTQKPTWSRVPRS